MTKVILALEWQRYSNGFRFLWYSTFDMEAENSDSYYDKCEYARKYGEKGRKRAVF
jgi:hypothetical protein